MVYIYQEIDWSQWERASFTPTEDVDDYYLAIEDRSIATYRGYKDGTAKIDLKKLSEDQRFSIDIIVEITDLLTAFFATDTAFRRAVEEYEKKFYHPSRRKLIFT